jgi:putative membrane protein
MWWLQTYINSARDQWHGSWWDHMGPGMMGWGVSGSGWFGVIFMVVWWIGVLLGVAALVRWLFAWNKQTQAFDPSPESALDIAKKRYARGEIDQEQYRALKRELES